MKRFFLFLLFSLFVFFFSFCGKKGPLMPPLKLKPQPVNNLMVTQRGQDLILTWTNPTTYIDGNPMHTVAEVEIWIVEEKKIQTLSDLSSEEFEKKAKRIVAIGQDKLSNYKKSGREGSDTYEYYYEIEKEQFSSFRIYFGLRVRDQKKRISDFSTLSYIEPQSVLLPPFDIQYTIHKEKLEIRWKESKKNIDNSSPSRTKGYNIYRKEEGSYFRRLNTELIEENLYQDYDFVFNRTYYYFVRASSSEFSPFVESSNSREVEVFVKDIFPPAPPSGLVSIAGDDFITLSWDENKENDLLGYMVWRKSEDEENFTVLAHEPILGNSYIDSTVEKKKRYYYAITAHDQKGNVSEKSKIVSIKVKGLF